MINFDYGYKPEIMVVGDVEFSNLLHKANIFGLGYISIPKSVLEAAGLKIVLIFNNAEYGKKVMKSFWSWIDASDGNADALGLDIIDKDENGYTICFYQDPNLLLERTVPKELRDWVSPYIMNICHFKEIDNVSEYFAYFKKAIKFSKCSILGGTTSAPFEDFDEIIKSKINVYTLDTIPDDSILLTYKNKGNIETKDRKEFNNMEIDELDDHRIKALKYFFPITYDKLKYKNYLKGIIDRLSNDFKIELIYQAICNIVLAFRIDGDNISGESNQLDGIEILEYLVNNYETFDSFYPDDAHFTHEIIIDQINKDETYLNEQMKEEPKC